MKHVSVKLNEDKKTTGNFEVTLNGSLIHSKKTGGLGRCQTQGERDSIYTKIQAHLEGLGLQVPEPKPELAEPAGCLII